MTWQNASFLRPLIVNLNFENQKPTVMELLETAKRFGISLDKDDYATTKSLIAEDCQYIIGEMVLVGPSAIADSYEQNMIAGKKKMDKLEWGESKIEVINKNEFLVHFTDYLTHKNIKYTHRCTQLISITDNGLITKIEHQHDQKEQDQLNDFYKSVGIPLVK